MLVKTFAEHGRLLSDGLNYIDSWVEFDGPSCFQLMTTDKPALFESWTARWADLLHFEIARALTGSQLRRRFRFRGLSGRPIWCQPPALESSCPPPR
jgi:hypothetical protein